MKLVPINVDLYLLSFDAFKFSLGSRLHLRGGCLYLILIFLNVNPQTWRQNHKVRSSNFHNISDITNKNLFIMILTDCTWICFKYYKYISYSVFIKGSVEILKNFDAWTVNSCINHSRILFSLVNIFFRLKELFRTLKISNQRKDAKISKKYK